MFMYQRFLVRDGDHFHPHQFPQVEAEMDVMDGLIAKLPAVYKAEMLLSCLKNHPINSEHSVNNPELAEIINSKKLQTGSIEALFTSCSDNPSFRQELEAYIKQRVKEPTTFY